MEREMSIVPTDKYHFRDWEGRVFGSGYGSGEPPIMAAIKTFFDSLEEGRQYDYRILEEKLGGASAWLLINALSRGKTAAIEWGTSARFGWLTASGEHVRDFVKKYTAEELVDILMSDEGDPPCMCDGSLKGHESCGKNPMVNEAYANKLKYDAAHAD
jgi:hypothetical protein